MGILHAWGERRKVCGGGKHGKGRERKRGEKGSVRKPR